MVTSSTPMPMPAIMRHRQTPKPVVWNAMISVAAQYPSMEKVKIARRPYLSATKPNTKVPMNRPKKVEATNSAGPEKMPTDDAGQKPGLHQAGDDIAGHEQVVELEHAAERQQRDHQPDMACAGQPVEPRQDGGRAAFAPCIIHLHSSPSRL